MMHVMLDLETLSTRSNAIILSIGAVAFDPVKDIIGDSYYANLDIDLQKAVSGHICEDTLRWWMAQGDEARKRAFAGGDTHGALHSFKEWSGSLGTPKDDLKVWGNGAAFDNAILSSLYSRINMQSPWHFYNDRCYRTIKALRPDIKLVRVGVHHDPRDDAESQARHLIKILQAMNVSG